MDYMAPEQESPHPFVAALAYVLIMTAIVCIMIAADFDDASWITLLFVNVGFSVAYLLVDSPKQIDASE